MHVSMYSDSLKAGTTTDNVAFAISQRYRESLHKTLSSGPREPTGRNRRTFVTGQIKDLRSVQLNTHLRRCAKNLFGHSFNWRRSLRYKEHL